MINWLYACQESNALTEENTGLPLKRIGTREFLVSLLRSIAYREGFGDILAEGLVRAVEKVPEEARNLLDLSVQPVGELDPNLPRVLIVHALLDPMEPRMSRPIAHAGFARAALMFNRMDPGSNPITPEVFREIAKAFWGSAEAADSSSYEGKALAAIKIQNRNLMEDSLGLCDFGWPLAYSFSRPGGVGDPDLEKRIFTAVTGRDDTMIEQCVERIALLQRAIQVREGRKIPEDDYPPEINFTEAFQPLVPTGDDREGDGPMREGSVLDRDKFTDMLKEYYSIRGLDRDTGMPLKETLTRLDLTDL
jgi:aldehyde:ferredoxin oxidoreductase